MGKIQISRATPSDVPALLPLVSDYWTFESISGFEPERIAGQLMRLLSQPDLGAGWIASVAGSPAGYLLAVYVFSLEHLGVTAEIDEFFVTASQRGSRIGVALLEAAETEFRRTGLTNVSLQLARNNDAARRFYHARGYTERAGYELLDKVLDGAISTSQGAISTSQSRTPGS